MPGSSQNFVKLESIKEGVGILKSGQVISVLMVSSVNFALKSENEQKAIIHRFQDFFNSLDFKLQIVIQSRDLNIDPYLEDLKEREKRQEDELLRVQTKEYHDFIQALVETSDIMEKNFYIVVPYSLGEEEIKISLWKKAKGVLKKRGKEEEEEEFRELRSQLMRRVELISSSMKSMGMRAVPLNSQEMAELFYNLYNPEEKAKKKLADISQLKLD